MPIVDVIEYDYNSDSYGTSKQIVKNIDDYESKPVTIVPIISLPVERTTEIVTESDMVVNAMFNKLDFRFTNQIDVNRPDLGESFPVSNAEMVGMQVTGRGGAYISYQSTKNEKRPDIEVSIY